MKSMREIGEHILKALSDPDLFARHFQPAESWAPWQTVIRVLFGVPLSNADMALFHEATGRTQPFGGPVGEAWLLCGRRSGKSRILALIAVCLATFRDYTPFLAPGERGVAMVLAVDKDQAAVIFRYAHALIEATPMLRVMVTNVTADTLDLDNGVSIEVHPSNFKSVRGPTLVAALCDEASFWRAEDSRNPAAAVLTALRPGLSTIPGAPLLVATSVYAMDGSVYEAFTKHHGQDDSPVMVWRAPTLTMNPTFRKEVVTAALTADHQSAAAEYSSEFLTDLRAFLDEEVIQDGIDHGCHERPPSQRHQFLAFVDPSGGRRDSFTMAIAHRSGDQLFLDVVREARPPLDPAVVVEGFAKTLKLYRITKVTGDAYAGEWPVTVFRSHGIAYESSELNRSEIYLETGPLMAQGRARLVDVPRLTSQLRQLERRSTPAGRDRVDHGPGGHDDVANAAMGAIYLASKAKAMPHDFDPRRTRPEYSVT